MEYWRRVPKVNILVRQRSSHQSNTILRIFLVLLFLSAAFIMLSQYRLRVQAETNIENSIADTRNAQRQLDAAQAEIEPLRTKINNHKNQLKLARDQYRKVTSGLIDWHAAMSALLGVQAKGVSFTSITTNPDGIVSISGEARATSAMTNLPAQFSVVSDILDFQGIQWDTRRDPPIFIATFKVR